MEQILLIDTSTDICAVGLARDGELLNFLVKEDCKLQSAIIHHLIDEIMKSTSTQLEDLSAVAVCSGPGSYTGLRIGMAVAKGLCYALQKPLIANHKLELLAQQKIQVNGDYWQYGVVLTARTDEYFYASYDAEMNVIHQPIHGDAEMIKKVIDELSVTSTCLIGDAIAQQTFGEQIRIANAVSLPHWAPWASDCFKLNEFEDIAQVVPFYMKEVYIQGKG